MSVATSDVFDRAAAFSMASATDAGTDRRALAHPVTIGSGAAIFEEEQ